MYLPYFNITGKNKEYEYSYFLYVLIRSFGFKGSVTKEVFIKKGLEKGLKKSNLYKIWSKGAYKNMFFRGISEDRIYLVSTDNFELVIEKVPSYILNNIKGIIDFKLFLHTSFLGRAGYINKDGENTSIGTKKIARIHNTTRQTVNNRNKRATKFNLDVINRFCKTEDGYNIKTTNEYKAPIRIIKNKYCKMNGTPTKLVKKFVMPLFVKNNFTGDLYKKCRDRFDINEFYEFVNINIFSGQIYKLTN